MANEYLTRTPSSSGNEKVWTLSAWIKTNGTSDTNYIFGYLEEGASPTPRGTIQFNESNVDGKTTVGWNPTGSAWYQTRTDGDHRDSGDPADPGDPGESDPGNFPGDIRNLGDLFYFPGDLQMFLEIYLEIVKILEISDLSSWASSEFRRRSCFPREL